MFEIFILVIVLTIGQIVNAYAIRKACEVITQILEREKEALEKELEELKKLKNNL